MLPSWGKTVPKALAVNKSTITSISRIGILSSKRLGFTRRGAKVIPHTERAETILCVRSASTSSGAATIYCSIDLLNISTSVEGWMLSQIPYPMKIATGTAIMEIARVHVQRDDHQRQKSADKTITKA